jgi:hypothetical protein
MSSSKCGVRDRDLPAGPECSAARERTSAAMRTIINKLGRSAAGPGLDVPVIHRICERRAPARMESGRAIVATSSRGLASQSMAILAELRSLRVSGVRANWVIRFSATRYSLRSSNSSSTGPVMWAGYAHRLRYEIAMCYDGTTVRGRSGCLRS